MNRIAKIDQRFVWHPFTQMRDWMASEPRVIVSGQGAWLKDISGKRYLDGNSSIWTNLHGHNHPAINRALKAQIGRIAHSSALGLANVPSALLAEKLVTAAPANAGEARMTKVFFSDDGSTAIEAGLKMAFEYARRHRKKTKPRFLSLARAYHGDTIGAVSLGHIDLFHKSFGPLLFKSDQARAPYCYRCPYNRAKPERKDAREYRKCGWECLGQLETQFKQRKKAGGYDAFVFEPMMQGAAGMIAQPHGWLSGAARIARDHGALLFADEIMTGFGRTGTSGGPGLFGCDREKVSPDLMAVAKGLTGGYLPMGATLCNRKIFDAFLGKYKEFKTFFHGHSYSGNQLGSAAALASLKLLEGSASEKARSNLESSLSKNLERLWCLPQVGDIRQSGLMAGIELVENWRTRKPYPLKAQAGTRVCEKFARLGVLTRPIGNVVVFMPPFCTTPGEVEDAIGQLILAIKKTL